MTRSLAAGLVCVALANVAFGATIFERTELVAGTAAADAQLPDAIDFEITAAGTYVVTLRDLGVPAPLGSLRAIVTRDLQVVAEVEVSYPTGVPPQPDPQPATKTFVATAGAYRIHVLGTGRQGEAGGFFGVSVAAAGGAPIVDASDAIAAGSATTVDESAFLATFDIATSGSYQLDVTDLAFPAALAQVNVRLQQRTGGTPQIVLNAPGTFNVAAPGSYELIVIATAGVQHAGMYSARVSGAGSVPHQRVNAVGAMPPPIDLNLSAAGQYDLTVTDREFPAALSGVAVAVTQNGIVLGSRTSTGTSAFSAAQGAAQLFAIGIPADVGAFAVRVAQGTNVAHANVHIADASADPATPAIYSVSPSQPVAAGAYRLRLEDFAFSRALTSLHAAVVQGDQIIARTDAEGVLDATLQVGRVKVLVAAVPPTVSGNGLFGLSFTAQSGGAAIFDSTQGVGGLFRPAVVQVSTAGQYDITLADLGFPSPLLEGALAITRGTELIGQIFGAGTVPGQQLASGTYVVNFIGRPAAGKQHGTYGLKIADTPPAPVVTLSASPTSVTSGGRTSLQWSATNATTCTAGNGWSGSKAVSGTEQSQVLSANTTFELRCTGAGGSTDASVSVTVTAVGRGDGGGGSMDILLLIYMSAWTFIALTRRR